MRAYHVVLISVFLTSVALGETPTAQPTSQPAAQEDEYETVSNIFYLPIPEAQADDYQKQQCRLDVYYPKNPKNKKNFPTIVFFHGGGMTGGDKYIPEEFKNKGIAVVAVKYRLNPQVKCPVYIQDAAAAVAWTFKNIAKYGGDPDSIFVSGHSAGGYLTFMVGLDKRWLKEYGIDSDKIAGLIPFSGHTITHMTVRGERGIPTGQPIVDEYAPLYYVRKDTPPILLITGDRERELLGRYEENAYFLRMMKINENTKVTLKEFPEYEHGLGPVAFNLGVEWAKGILKERAEQVSQSQPAAGQ